MLNVPVAFLIFNRPDTTAKVFNEIARAKPTKLLVIADGPRSAGESDKCAASRAIIQQVDWECEVLTNYSDVNLGCKKRVSSGLDWVFDCCEEAIVLEDDCLPSQSFFSFCRDLLDRHRENEQVMTISGDNFQFGRKRGSSSYYYSRYPHIWGWATWRRAWRRYDIAMKAWPSLRETSWLRDIMGDEKVAAHWRRVFDINYQGVVDSWDIQWIFACWRQNGLTAVANNNLVSNIGFRDDATHTKTDIYGISALEAQEIRFPLTHPPVVACDKDADKFTFEHTFAKEMDTASIYRRIGRKLVASLPSHMRDSINHLRVEWVKKR